MSRLRRQTICTHREPTTRVVSAALGLLVTAALGGRGMPLVGSTHP